MTLDELLKEWRRTAFEWGSRDCLLSVGDYIAANGGKDIASLFRGRYSTEDEAIRLMNEAGGPDALIDQTGIPRTDTPQAGDIVLVNIARGVAGVHTGGGVAFRLERGMAEINLRFVNIVAAWRIPCA